MEQTEIILHALEVATRDPASPLHFSPVRLRARIDGWTEARQRRFVAALALTGSTSRAAAIVGMTQHSAARLRYRPDGASFARACAAASVLAKHRRRAAVAAGKEDPEGSERPETFRPGQASTYSTTEPSRGKWGEAEAGPNPVWIRQQSERRQEAK